MPYDNQVPKPQIQGPQQLPDPHQILSAWEQALTSSSINGCDSPSLHEFLQQAASLNFPMQAPTTQVPELGYTTRWGNQQRWQHMRQTAIMSMSDLDNSLQAIYTQLATARQNMARQLGHKPVEHFGQPRSDGAVSFDSFSQSNPIYREFYPEILAICDCLRQRQVPNQTQEEQLLATILNQMLTNVEPLSRQLQSSQSPEQKYLDYQQYIIMQLLPRGMIFKTIDQLSNMSSMLTAMGYEELIASRCCSAPLTCQVQIIEVSTYIKITVITWPTQAISILMTHIASKDSFSDIWNMVNPLYQALITQPHPKTIERICYPLFNSMPVNRGNASIVGMLREALSQKFQVPLSAPKCKTPIDILALFSRTFEEYMHLLI